MKYMNLPFIQNYGILRLENTVSGERVHVGAKSPLINFALTYIAAFKQLTVHSSIIECYVSQLIWVKSTN